MTNSLLDVEFLGIDLWQLDHNLDHAASSSREQEEVYE